MLIPSAATEEGGTLLAKEEGTSDEFEAPVEALVLAAELGVEPGCPMALQLLSTTELWTPLETGPPAGERWLEGGKE